MISLKELFFGKPEDPTVEHFMAVQAVKGTLQKATEKGYDAVIIVGRKMGEMELDSEGFEEDEAEYWLGKMWHKAQHKGLLGHD